MVDFAVVPSRTAYLNVDLQTCFVAGYPMSAPDGLAILRRANGLAAVCRAAGILVIHTAHVLRPDGSDAGVLGELVPGVVQGGFLAKGADSAALHPDLLVDSRDLLLEKPRFGAFHGTDLERILRARSIDTLIIGGITTDVCCDTTAREANARDFRVLFLGDGTATGGSNPTTAAARQRATLETLGSVFAQILTVDEVVRKIQDAGATPVARARGDEVT
jgi:nicotinamidase-related amidase